MSTNETAGGEPLVYGVPGKELVAALRGAGLSEDNVVAVLGRAIATSAGLAPAVTAGFTFQTPIAQVAAECTLGYQRLFVHPDFIDGVTVVQAGSTPEEIGFNARFHSIEAEFDGIARDLQTSSNCVAELRRELYGLARELEAKITEIDSRLDAKGKDKDSKDTKEGKDGKESKEGKEKDTKEGKDKEGKDGKESKEGKEHKDGKESKEGKDHIDKVQTLEKIQSLEKQLDTPVAGPAVTAAAPSPAEAKPTRAKTRKAKAKDAAARAAEAESPEPVDTGTEGTERTFIRLDDRPPVGEEALQDPEPRDE